MWLNRIVWDMLDPLTVKPGSVRYRCPHCEGEMVNEDIRCRPLSIPPYREEPGFACQWEYWLDS